MIYHNIERELLGEDFGSIHQFEIEYSLQDSWEIKQKHLINRKHLSFSSLRRSLSLGKQFKKAGRY